MYLTSDINCPIEEFSISDTTVMGVGLTKVGCSINPSTNIDCRSLTFPTS